MLSGNNAVESGKIGNCVKGNTEIFLDAFDSTWWSKSALKEEKCKALFLFIYFLLTDTRTDAEDENVHIAKVREYVRKNLQREISLNDLAGHVHLATPYLCALFKQHMGKTIVEYINSERIAMAKQMMHMQEATLTEIAEACGYTNYNYFSEVFRRTVGVSPSQYRKGIRK